MITSRPAISSVARKFLTTLTCEVIVNGSPLTINTNFMTVNLQVITRNKPCSACPILILEKGSFRQLNTAKVADH